jgi:hypothetical protein
MQIYRHGIKIILTIFVHKLFHILTTSKIKYVLHNAIIFLYYKTLDLSWIELDLGLSLKLEQELEPDFIFFERIKTRNF